MALALRRHFQANMAAYEKTFEDELDWSLLDQLHQVVLQISTFCFRTKQVCVTIEVAVAGLLARFLGDRLDRSIFVAGLLIPLVFWILDSIGYYYQVKLRGVMGAICDRLRTRNTPQILAIETTAVIDDRRLQGGVPSLLKNAIFNHSMWLYPILMLTSGFLWLAFESGMIQ